MQLLVYMGICSSFQSAVACLRMELGPFFVHARVPACNTSHTLQGMCLACALLETGTGSVLYVAPQTAYGCLGSSVERI